METETISARNVVDLIFKTRFHSDICGRSTLQAEETATTEANLDTENAQTVLKREEIVKKPSEQSADEEDFVLGWDC